MSMINNPESRFEVRTSQAELTDQAKDTYVALVLLVCVTIFGALGFQLVEGWPLLDSLYMTIITLSTVGFGEVRDLSAEGKIFASILIMGGMSVAAYCFSTIGRSALRGELYRLRGMTKMKKQIEDMEDHIIVCGFGRLAKFIIPELIDQEVDFVVIDNRSEGIDLLAEQRIPHVEGNASEDAVLLAAGVTRAKSLLALTSNDAENVFITLSARHLAPEIRIMARTEAEEGEKKLHRAGANQVVAPYRVSSTRVIQQLLHPNVKDFLEIACDDRGSSLIMEQVVVPESSPLSGQPIFGSGIRKKTGVMIVGLVDRRGLLKPNPGPEDLIEPGSSMILVGTGESIQRFEVLNGG